MRTKITILIMLTVIGLMVVEWTVVTNTVRGKFINRIKNLESISSELHELKVKHRKLKAMENVFRDSNDSLVRCLRESVTSDRRVNELRDDMFLLRDKYERLLMDEKEEGEI